MIEEGPTMPHALGPEKAVLSVLMKYPNRLAESALDPEIFYMPAHRTIYRQVKAVAGELDLVTFVDSLQKRGLLGDIGGPAVITEIFTYAPNDLHFEKHVAEIRDCHCRRMVIRAANAASEAAFDRSDSDRYQAALAKADEVLKQAAAPGKQTLLKRAYALRFDPETEPPADEVCLVIGDVPIAARGNLTGVQGKSKVGKTAVIAAILAAAHRGHFVATGDTFCIEWRGGATGAIVHLDTEQSRADWHDLVKRAIKRSGIPAMSDQLVSLPLVIFARSERLEILRQALRYERTRLGSVDLVVIDGIADLCASPNDEAESLELVSQIMALAQEFHCAIVTVLHENPGSENAKTRGHLGSELNRKAFANLRVDKDAETGVSTIYGTDMRKRDLPKEQGFCFAWDDTAGMHTFQGRAAGVKAAHKQAAAIAEATEFFRLIFTPRGTNPTCPALTPDEAIEAWRDNGGTGEAPKRDAMKKRMQRAVSLGVLRKAEETKWAFNTNGTSGT